MNPEARMAVGVGVLLLAMAFAIVRRQIRARRHVRLYPPIGDVETEDEVVRAHTQPLPVVTMCNVDEPLDPKTEQALLELVRVARTQAQDHDCEPETVIDPIEVPPSIFSSDDQRRYFPGPKYVRCRVCKRPLASHVSQAAGFGPVCAARVKAMEVTPRDT